MAHARFGFAEEARHEDTVGNASVRGCRGDRLSLRPFADDDKARRHGNDARRRRKGADEARKVLYLAQARERADDDLAFAPFKAGNTARRWRRGEKGAVDA